MSFQGILDLKRDAFSSPGDAPFAGIVSIQRGKLFRFYPWRAVPSFQPCAFPLSRSVVSSPFFPRSPLRLLRPLENFNSTARHEHERPTFKIFRPVRSVTPTLRTTRHDSAKERTPRRLVNRGSNDKRIVGPSPFIDSDRSLARSAPHGLRCTRS